MAKKLERNEIERHLKTVPKWSPQGDTIIRDFTFETFAQAISFVNQVASSAEAANHHPDIDIRYDKVRLALSTHDSGGLTLSDFSLARQIDGLPELSG